MTSATLSSSARPAASMSVFERYLTLWVLLCIVTGIVLGQLLPTVFHAIGRMEVAQVNLPVGLLIWVMIIPMLVKVDFGALHRVRQRWRGIGVTLFVNWPVKPFSMALLGRPRERPRDHRRAAARRADRRPEREALASPCTRFYVQNQAVSMLSKQCHCSDMPDGNRCPTVLL